MNIDKERELFDQWVLKHPDNLDITKYEENIMFDAWLASASRDGYKLVPVELSWQKADEIAMEHWNKYQYSLEVYSQGKMASSTSIEMARVAWCKNKAHQIMQEYKFMLGAVDET